MKRLSSLLATAMLALCFGAGQAVAAGEDPGAAQAAGQSAESGQTAGGDSGAYQAGPTNSAGSIRVLSPGTNGAVSQSNSSTAGSVAANGNSTAQTTNQSQTGGYGSDYTQIAGQEAVNDQSANAGALAVQIAPKNTASSIRVLSPGDDGDVTQSNSASAGALAANGNETNQAVDQSQPGGGYGSDSTQIAGQDAANTQDANAAAAAVQVKPENTASSIRVLSPGDDGGVTQSNSTTAVAAALNGNATDQSVDQSQGSAAPTSSKATGQAERGTADPYGSSYTQIAGQSAENHQSADAGALAVQVAPKNTASSIRVLSPGDDGDVTQSNSTTAVAAALNGNTTNQSIGQSQSGGGLGSGYTQVAGQEAVNDQSANAGALAVQIAPKNTASSIRVLSPGDDGDVTQSNDATAVGIAANGNATNQALGQSQTGSGYGSGYLQVAGQGAWNGQDAAAGAAAFQLGAKNDNAPIRVGSPGSGGSVEQSNEVGALALALNLNATCQSLWQSQTGYGSSYLQVAGQGAWSGQRGGAEAIALQGVMPSQKK